MRKTDGRTRICKTNREQILNENYLCAFMLCTQRWLVALKLQLGLCTDNNCNRVYIRETKQYLEKKVQTHKNIKTALEKYK